VKIKGMAEAMSFLRLETFSKAITNTANPTVKVFILGITERSTTVNGLKASSKAMESGRAFRMNRISVSGSTIKPKVMAYTYGETVIDTKESGKTILDMEVAQISLQTETATSGSMSRANHRVQDSTSGQTDLCTKANFIKG